MINTVVCHFPIDAGRARAFISYLFALHSLWAFAAAGLWVRVWLMPDARRVALAALATAALLMIAGLRLSSAVVLQSGL